MDKRRNDPVRDYYQYTTDHTLRLCTSLVSGINANGKYDDWIREIGSTDHTTICNAAFDYSAKRVRGVDEFFEDYIVYNLLRKSPFLRVKNDPEANAREKFFLAESTCKDTNKRVLSALSQPGSALLQPLGLAHLLQVAQKKIERVLGKFDWDVVISGCDFGPGASTRLPRSRSVLQEKVSGNLHVTGPLEPLFRAYQKHKPGMFEDCEVVVGNKIVFVPKDAKTLRTIAIEPDFNMFVQKAIGKRIRRRLLTRTKERIDLNDQTVNQKLARLGSLGYDFATIDLSAASDTVSYELVAALLPEDWLNALLLTRSPVGVLDGKTIRYNKFSSMGNGYTFELETLIFWAIGKSVSQLFGTGTESVFVYGDDIIFSKTYAPFLIDALAMCGFSTNTAKTFVSGPFYESCGKHFYEGTDVTPLYVDKVPQRQPECIALSNEIMLLASRLGNGLYRDARLRNCFETSLAYLRPWLRNPTGPVSLKGNCLIGDFDEARPRRSRRFDGYKVRCLVETAETRPFRCMDLAVRASLFTLELRKYDDGTLSTSEVLTGVRRYRSKDVVVQEWSYLGPWL